MTMGRRRSPSIRAGRRGQIDPERRPSSIHDPPNHSLRPPGRHTYASLLIHEGRSPQLVAAALGHASGELVWRRYAHVFDEARLAPSVPMVEAIEVARVAVGASGVRPMYDGPVDEALGADPMNGENPRG